MTDPGSIYLKYGGQKIYLGTVTSLSVASRASIHSINPPAVGMSGDEQAVDTILLAPKTHIDIDIILDCTKLNFDFYQCVDYLRSYQKFYAKKDAGHFADFICIQLTKNNAWWFALAISNFEFKAYPGKPTLISIGITGMRTGFQPFTDPTEGYTSDCATW
jgi:hypothetical protein